MEWQWNPPTTYDPKDQLNNNCSKKQTKCWKPYRKWFQYSHNQTSYWTKIWYCSYRIGNQTKIQYWKNQKKTWYWKNLTRTWYQKNRTRSYVGKIERRVRTEPGSGTNGTKNGYSIGRTELGFNTWKIESIVNTKGTKWAKHSPPPKLEFGIATEEHQPRHVGAKKTKRFQHSWIYKWFWPSGIHHYRQ
jgi:hypothetical protein